MFRCEVDDPLIRSNQNWAPNCPRCSSSNTKFCYYNNYSLSQPRYFCKNCRRYWTRGGSLRNVPVGGGCRRNRRSKSSFKPRQPPASASRCSESSGESGSEIDLAAVFANFLSQKPEGVEPDDVASRSGVSSSSGCAPEEAGIGQFELQCFVGDHEVEQGLLWNDVASWQPMVHGDEMEAFSSSMNNNININNNTNNSNNNNDYYYNNNSNNQVNDGIWSSFDCSWV